MKNLIVDVQSALGLVADGDAGVKTWTAIHARICPAAQEPIPPTKKSTGGLLSHLDCMAVFGEPEKEKGMVLWDIPSHLEIGVIPKKLYCSKAMVVPLTKAFENLIDTGCVNELKTWDGCFNIRSKRGSGTPSLHSWGVAIDINAAWNRMGQTPTLSKEFVLCFTNAGFSWGGDWSSPDGMHFQLSKETFNSQV
jgi:hypothetical protein